MDAGIGAVARADFAVPGPSRFPGSNESLRFMAVRFAGLLAIELPTERARDVNEAGTLFPAAPSFPELPGAGVFNLAAACTLLHAELAYFL
ncbi:MAG TPA: hypothetical protein VKV15_16720 [Bryobacteraceae bacterium]|nr:hypothetical protein [Bryobacteraceae bacterium]